MSAAFDALAEKRDRICTGALAFQQAADRETVRACRAGEIDVPTASAAIAAASAAYERRTSAAWAAFWRLVGHPCPDE